jgi:hypothetical protein
MVTFLFVMASVAVLAGLMGLMAGHMPRSTGRLRRVQGLLASRRPGAGRP